MGPDLTPTYIYSTWLYTSIIKTHGSELRGQIASNYKVATI